MTKNQLKRTINHPKMDQSCWILAKYLVAAIFNHFLNKFGEFFILNRFWPKRLIFAPFFRYAILNRNHLLHLEKIGPIDLISATTLPWGTQYSRIFWILVISPKILSDFWRTRTIFRRKWPKIGQKWPTKMPITFYVNILRT